MFGTIYLQYNYLTSGLNSSMSVFVPLVNQLHKIVVMLHFFPREEIDDVTTTRQILGSGMQDYHDSLQTEARNYLKMVNDLFKGRRPITHAPNLDVSNLHRLLELTVHSVLTYKHCRFFSDLSFERKHKLLKTSVQRDRNPTITHGPYFQT